MKRFIALSLALAATVCAQETVFLGSLTSQAAVGLPNTHHNKGDFLLGQTIFDGTIKSYLDEAMVYVNGQIVHDALGSQSTNGSSAFVADDGTYALKLREAYIDWKGEMLRHPYRSSNCFVGQGRRHPDYGRLESKRRIVHCCKRLQRIQIGNRRRAPIPINRKNAGGCLLDSVLYAEHSAACQGESATFACIPGGS